MAWRLLGLVLIVLSCAFSFDYEVIRDHEGDHDTLSLYLNNRECLSIIGSDSLSIKRLYAFVARLIEQSELQNDPDLLYVRATKKSGTEIFWQDITLITLSEAEKSLNERHQNNMTRLRDFARSIQIGKGSSPIALETKVKFKSISTIELAELASQSFGAFFPASHPFLPIGTRLRVMNPTKDWSIVVQVVRHDKWVSGSSLGLNTKAIRALGMERTGAVKTQFI